MSDIVYGFSKLPGYTCSQAETKPAEMPTIDGRDGVNIPGLGQAWPAPMPTFGRNDGVNVPGMGTVRPAPMPIIKAPTQKIWVCVRNGSK